MLRCFVLLFTLLMLSSCSFFQVHKQTIIQGNEFNNKQIQQLKIGMSKAEVIDILGNSILTNPFWPNTITYVYTYNDHKTKPIKKYVVLEFSNGQLTSIHR